MKSHPALICNDERRRHKVRRAKDWNGLDYLEVAEDQRHLTVFFLDKAPQGLRPENVVIEPCGGGPPVEVVDLRLCSLEDEERDDCLHVTVDRPGGFMPYRLCLRETDERGRPTDKPFPGIDPRYACVEFDFKVGCRSDFDCKTEPHCPPEPREEPAINYLAKDYASFRQLILDRLAVTVPEWRERHVPDLGVTLVELMAYVGDHLSYYQDAVGTEAYLDTARRRISVRRHVRLVDYPMHDGCNARAWVFVNASDDHKFEPGDFHFITGFHPPPPEGKALMPEVDLRGVPGDLYEVFEPILSGPFELREAHNEIRIYTWGDRECCLPRGATRATLRDEWIVEEKPPEENPYKKEKQDYGCEPPDEPEEPRRRLNLKKGDLLLFEEILGPKTGHPQDADLSHRHVVRLTRVKQSVDKLYNKPILEIEWSWEDALPFPLCVSSIGGDDCRLLDPVSVARGNILLADHGLTVGEEIGPVEPGKTPPRCEGEGRLAETPQTIQRFVPVLKGGPLTFREPVPSRRTPASRLLAQDPRKALPQVDLGGEWSVRRDLLGSAAGDFHFVAEVDDDGRAHLRFGDGEMGRAPLAGATFDVTYRVGNGPAGNVGAEAIRHLVLREGLTVSGVTFKPRNPLAARGGTAPEPVAEVRLLAPHAFRKDLQRAITADDYARIVERDFAGRVQRAAAVLRWAGSWAEALVAVDPFAGEEDVHGLLRAIERRLQRYRRIGHDVVVKRAVAVSLDIELLVCVRPAYVKGHVQAALLEVLRGYFHPDKLSFGEGIALSKLIAAAQAVTGVESVTAKKFQRQHEEAELELENGFLPLGPLEIARLDNDPRFPDNGRITLTMRGGR
ncbi:MAG TPA: putative baseplate assembly protein [Thermoanaerobaculia bacterium]